jgi:hypothetical protein
MHAHDRTLIAKLGFADPDKKDDLHDLACRYIGTKAVANRLASLIYPAQQKPLKRTASGSYRMDGEMHYGEYVFDGVIDSPAAIFHRVNYEVPVSKGEGQYKTTIGFMDVELICVVSSVSRFSVIVDDRPPRPQPEEASRDVARILVEVKINPIGCGEILRQINLYREFLGDGRKGPPWVAATAFPISESEAEQLKASGVFHVELKDGFIEYARANQADTRKLAQSVEL